MKAQTLKYICTNLKINQVHGKMLIALSEHYPRTLLDVYNVWIICNKSFDTTEKVLQKELDTGRNAMLIYYDEYNEK